MQGRAIAPYSIGMTDGSTSTLLEIARRDGRTEMAQPIDLAERVRALRTAQGWTLAQAAERAGLARSTLSKIENGHLSPTYEALKKLATGLGMSLPRLFTSAPSDQVTARLTTTVSGEGQPLLTTTYEHELLGKGLSRKDMLPYRTRIRARRVEEFEGWVRHGGEEFLYVLTGRIRLYTEFYEPQDLARGDSVYYDATMGHNVISTSADDATILWVTSLT